MSAHTSGTGSPPSGSESVSIIWAIFFIVPKVPETESTFMKNCMSWSETMPVIM